MTISAPAATGQFAAQAAARRNAVVLCTDKRMLVPALFVAESVRRHASGTIPFDIVIVAEPGTTEPRDRDWMAARGMLLHENVDYDRYRGVGFIDPRLSVATLVRLLLPDLFADRYDSLLYLDCDLTLHADVSQLFRLDVSPWPVAAQRRGMLFFTPLLAEEGAAHFARLKMTPPVRYCNAGVMLIDVAGWRAENLTARCFDFIREDPGRCRLIDEDALNGVLDGRFASLSPVWNMMPPRRWITDLSRVVEPGIVHYAGFDKPWKRFGHDKQLFPDLTAYRLYRDFLRESPWPGWLDRQWTLDDLSQNIASEMRWLGRRLMGSRNPWYRAHEPSRAEIRRYLAAFARHCAEEPFIDVEQGVTLRDQSGLRPAS
ncbi:MAG: glycosyltransferase family 8 protein [Planctomycetia bacterium]